MSTLHIFESLSLWRYWMYRARLDFKLRYRGAKLGIIWPILSVVVVVLVIGTVWGVLFNKQDKPGYYLYLFAGYPVWMAISSSVEHGCRAVRKKAAGGVPFFAEICERSVLTFIPFALVLPFVLPASWYIAGPGVATLVFLPLSLALLSGWVVGVICFLIPLVALMPDLRHLINAMMRLAFLATPIIWEVERLGQYQHLIWVNPFYVPLEATRQALTGTGDWQLLAVFALYTMLLLVSGILLLKLRMRKIVR